MVRDVSCSCFVTCKFSGTASAPWVSRRTKRYMVSNIGKYRQILSCSARSRPIALPRIDECMLIGWRTMSALEKHSKYSAFRLDALGRKAISGWRRGASISYAVPAYERTASHCRQTIGVWLPPCGGHARHDATEVMTGATGWNACRRGVWRYNRPGPR